jgi:mannosidase alpha-like ER degradation enhancer 1
VELNEGSTTCTAGAGTLLIEFSVLSRLTNDSRFENAAKNALTKLWSLKSHLGLWGNALNMETLQWIDPVAGVGAGLDSFYEYLFKLYILLGEEEYLDMFNFVSFGEY